MIFQIASTNPQFSHIIAKNPATIIENKKPFQRSLTKGQLYGWFTSEQNNQFCLYFKDSDTQTSYGREFEYLDTTRYCDPHLVLNLINEALRSASQSQQDIDGTTEKVSATCTFTLAIGPSLTNRFEKMSGGLITFEKMHPEIEWLHKVRILGFSVNEVLNKAQIVACMATLRSENTYLPMREADVVRYINILGRAKMPYYIWHMFVAKAITNSELFNKCKNLLDTYTGLRFQYGNTQMQRHSAIKQDLLRSDKASVLYDIGCGEMYHSVKLAKEYDQIVCYDSDPEYLEANENKIRKKQLVDKITFIGREFNIEEITSLGGALEDADILISEVLEHRSRQDSLKLLKALLESPARRIIVTVPNHSFNVHYGMEAGAFRHDDHKWEPTYADMYGFVSKANEVAQRAMVMNMCGDLVKGEGPTQLIVFSPLKELESKSVTHNDQMEGVM